MSLSFFLDFISGVGLFLLGMNILSESLSSLSGNKAETLLSKATASPLKGIFLGAGVTAVIQSSSATTMILMSMLDAGILNSHRALPVIMGAGIGTTVTAQILSLTDINTKNQFFSFLKPQIFAPFLILAGSIEKMIFKKKDALSVASLFIGLGVLFYGAELSDNALAPLNNSAKIHSLITQYTNPFLCFMAGCVITTILQSSSVAVGLLQTLSGTGFLNIETTIPLILGINATRCLPEAIVSIGSGKETKAAVLSSFAINFSGCCFFLLAFLFFPEGIKSATATKSTIAWVHTSINFLISFLFFPLIKI